MQNIMLLIEANYIANLIQISRFFRLSFQSDFPEIELDINASVFREYLCSRASRGSEIGPTVIAIKFWIVQAIFSFRGHRPPQQGPRGAEAKEKC